MTKEQLKEEIIDICGNELNRNDIYEIIKTIKTKYNKHVNKRDI